jgi:hypothetical protein
LVTNGLCILGVLKGYWDFVLHFLDEVLFQDVTHINDFLLLGDTHVAVGIMSSSIACQPFYFIWTIFPSFSFLFFFASFNRKIIYVYGDIMGLRSWEFI